MAYLVNIEELAMTPWNVPTYFGTSSWQNFVSSFILITVHINTTTFTIYKKSLQYSINHIHLTRDKYLHLWKVRKIQMDIFLKFQTCTEYRLASNIWLYFVQLFTHKLFITEQHILFWEISTSTYNNVLKYMPYISRLNKT